MEDLGKDTLAVNGYRYWPHFCETGELEKASKQIWDFYRRAILEGIFYDRDEALEIGLIREHDGQLIRAWTEPDYLGPKVNLLYEDNIMYHELNWFFNSRTYQTLTEYIAKFIGPDLDMCMARLIITLPVKLFPDYVRGLYLPMESGCGGSLTPLIKEKFRRVFFFAHNRWHQDTIDYPESDNLSYTTLISLTHRSGGQAPLLFCPESSALGEVPFPFDYRIDGETMFYRNDKGNFKLVVDRANLEPGDLFAWHAYNFHEVQPCFAKDPAMALRFNFAPRHCNNGIRDKRNIREAGRSLLSTFTALGGKSTDHIKENS